MRSIHLVAQSTHLWCWIVACDRDVQCTIVFSVSELFYRGVAKDRHKHMPTRRDQSHHMSAIMIAIYGMSGVP